MERQVFKKNSEGIRDLLRQPGLKIPKLWSQRNFQGVSLYYMLLFSLPGICLVHSIGPETMKLNRGSLLGAEKLVVSRGWVHKNWNLGIHR